MSRIGNRELIIPPGIEVNLKSDSLIVRNSKAQLEQKIPTVVRIEISNGVLKTKRINECKYAKQLHGTINSLIKGMIEGLTNGFKKELEINGVGYRAALQDGKLVLNVGKSHPIYYDIPSGINIVVLKSTKLIVEGISKQLVGEVAANIRSCKKPEPYKGKGIKYKNENIIRKVGKSAGK